MIGLDNIELSMELLNHRQEAVQQISEYLHGSRHLAQSMPPAQSVQVNGRSKGKQREGAPRLCQRTTPPLISSSCVFGTG